MTVQSCNDDSNNTRTAANANNCSRTAKMLLTSTRTTTMLMSLVEEQ